MYMKDYKEHMSSFQIDRVLWWECPVRTLLVKNMLSPLQLLCWGNGRALGQITTVALCKAQPEMI